MSPPITPDVFLISPPATLPHSIIFDILKVPTSQKYSMMGLFSTVPGSTWLYLAVPGSAQCPAKLFSEKSLIALQCPKSYMLFQFSYIYGLVWIWDGNLCVDRFYRALLCCCVLEKALCGLYCVKDDNVSRYLCYRSFKDLLTTIPLFTMLLLQLSQKIVSSKVIVSSSFYNCVCQ